MFTITVIQGDVNTDFEIGKSRTRCPGHGPRLGIAPEIGKSRTESGRGIIAAVAANLAAYAVNPSE